MKKHATICDQLCKSRHYSPNLGRISVNGNACCSGASSTERTIGTEPEAACVHAKASRCALPINTTVKCGIRSVLCERIMLAQIPLCKRSAVDAWQPTCVRKSMSQAAYANTNRP